MLVETKMFFAGFYTNNKSILYVEAVIKTRAQFEEK